MLNATMFAAIGSAANSDTLNPGAGLNPVIASAACSDAFAIN
jgi:hypothetical protein